VFIGSHNRMTVKRVAYAAVRQVAKKNKMMISRFAGLSIIISRIVSFE